MTKEESGRASITLLEMYVLLRGQLPTGITVYGPFYTIPEAMTYAGKNFPNDTWVATSMYKEIADERASTDDEIGKRRSNDPEEAS